MASTSEICLAAALLDARVANEGRTPEVTVFVTFSTADSLVRAAALMDTLLARPDCGRPEWTLDDTVAVPHPIERSAHTLRQADAVLTRHAKTSYLDAVESDCYLGNDLVLYLFSFAQSWREVHVLRQVCKSWKQLGEDAALRISLARRMRDPLDAIQTVLRYDPPDITCDCHFTFSCDSKRCGRDYDTEWRKFATHVHRLLDDLKFHTDALGLHEQVRDRVAKLQTVISREYRSWKPPPRSCTYKFYNRQYVYMSIWWWLFKLRKALPPRMADIFYVGREPIDDSYSYFEGAYYADVLWKNPVLQDVYDTLSVDAVACTACAGQLTSADGTCTCVECGRVAHNLDGCRRVCVVCIKPYCVFCSEIAFRRTSGRGECNADRRAVPPPG